MIKVIFKSLSSDSVHRSAEDIAAMQLKENLEKEFSAYPNAKGTIYILTSIRIFGEKRTDIDILIMGFIENFFIKNIKTINRNVVEELNIRSFICNMELKSHTANGVKREGTDYFVLYKDCFHNASKQCNDAKFSLLNHFKEQLSVSPFICDVLWFNGLSYDDLKNMRGDYVDNALHSGFKFRDLINVILRQTIVHYDMLDSFPNGENEYESIVRLFTDSHKPKGLTKRKFEMISQGGLEINNLMQEVGKKLTIVTGRAGTGKTIQLLQLAFRLADEDSANRCLILTYNHALVCDIERLIDFTPMPSKVDGRTVAIKTIHSFFISLMKECGIGTGHLNPTNPSFDSNYNSALKQLYDFVVKECKNEDIETLKDMAESHIDWDYILIDEAQDFSDIEKQILFKVYGQRRLIVADGVDQFMRTGFRQMWERGIDKNLLMKPKQMDLERRQKANLVTFVNAFAECVDIDWKIRPNTNLPGGEIKIYPKFTFKTYKQLKENCKRNNCENYDILILEPPNQVTKDKSGNRMFSKAKNYNEAGIPIFDGIKNKTTYPTKDQCRVYQYDSCRGLEGWCVVCADFDELIKYKSETYTPNEDALGFDPETIKKRSVYLWSLMPLTRPIDTLVITLKDPNSEVGQMLKKLSNTFDDFVEWKC